jgi:SSS family transporter
VFGPLDYAVLAGYFLLCAAVGWWTGRGQKNAGEFFKGGGAMPMWAVCLSILASETSALTFCAVPGQAYAGNHTYFQFVVGNLAGRLLVAFLFIPAFYISGITSVYEYLGLRFGPSTRGVASALFLVTRILASGVRLTVAAIIVQAVTGWNFSLCVVAFTVITVAYSVYGGIKSIIWTDVLQFFLFIGGAILASVLLTPGTRAAATLALVPDDKYRIIDPSMSLAKTYTLLTAAICGPILTFATHGTDQDLVQRMLTCKGSRQGSLSVVLSGLLSIPMVLLFLSIGTDLYGYYHGLHPELAAALPDRQDQIFPHFIVHELPIGIRGLVIAAVFAAAMSTTSSAIGALALVAVVDVLKRLRPGPEDAVRDLRLSRVMTAVMGALMIAVAIGFGRVSKSLLDLGLEVMTYAYGALLGVFVLGRLTTARGSDRGNVVAMLASVGAVLAVKFGVNRHEVVVAWPWFTVIGFAVTLGIGALFPTRATSSAYRSASAPPR